MKTSSKTKRIVFFAGGAMLAATGCTALGPMPATTAVAPLPAGRPSFEVQVGALPGVAAEGTYCVDAQGVYGVDCPDKMPSYQHSKAGGVYPAATGGLSVDVGRHFDGEFHGGRVELLVAGGTMPRVVGGTQESAH